MAAIKKGGGGTILAIPKCYWDSNHGFNLSFSKAFINSSILGHAFWDDFKKSTCQ